MKTGKLITVKAKGDFGYHPGLRVDIRKGTEYTMDESEWGDQLFERPSPDWLSPAEQEAAAAKKKEEKGGN